MPLTIYDYFNNGKSIAFNFVYFFRNLIFVGEHFNSWILWYLLSMIYGLTILLILYKKKVSLKKATIIGALFYIIGIISNVFTQSGGQVLPILYKMIKYTYSNGRIFNSLLYLCIGINISKKNPQKSVYHILIFILLVLICSIVPKSIKDIMTIFESVLLFIIVINLNFKNEQVSDICKYLSEKIYYWHLYFYSLLCLIYNKNNLNSIKGFKIFIECLTLSVVFGLALYLIDKKKQSDKNIEA